MNTVLAAWNEADEASAFQTMLACCGARRWSEAMVALRPFLNVESLSLTADELWTTMEESDWLEAFSKHPRIGERQSASAPTRSAAWSVQEQSGTARVPCEVLDQLARANAEYEQRFGFTYIVCATGRSAAEMLAILQRRLASDRAAELREAAEQQRQIMQIRLGKWLAE
jgi:2-oxo-4-hydroxy-4-carboxy-5-ureidoimidazoline decarboxylase